MGDASVAVWGAGPQGWDLGVLGEGWAFPGCTGTAVEDAVPLPGLPSLGSLKGSNWFWEEMQNHRVRLIFSSPDVL